MKTTVKNLRVGMLAALCALSASCVRDDLSGPAGDGRTVEANLLLSTQGTSRPTTRSSATEAETKVDNALVLFFLGTDDNAKLYAVSEGRNLEPADGPTPGVTFLTSFVVASADADREFSCLVVANCLDRTLADGTTLSVGTLLPKVGSLTRAGAQKSLTLAATDKPQSTPDELFPMSGYTSEHIKPSTSTGKKFRVSLLRDIARVSVMGTADNFKLTEVYIFKPSNRRAVVPLPSAFDAGSATSVARPSVPEGASALTTPWKYNVTDYGTVAGGVTQYEIYIPEADVLMGAGGTLGDANHTNRCAIVVGGIYNGATSYYRIDFRKVDADRNIELLNVLRNHSYNVVISAVSAAGEPTPEEAYASRLIHITADIVEWYDDNQEIVFDGADWVSFESKRVNFGDAEDIRVGLNMLSNRKPSEWTMEFGDAATGNASGAQTVTGSIFSVSKPADSADPAATTQGGDLIIRTRSFWPLHQTYTKDAQGNVTYDTSSPKNDPRSETLRIFIGRLEIAVTLIQYPSSGDFWIDGGSFGNVYVDPDISSPYRHDKWTDGGNYQTDY